MTIALAEAAKGCAPDEPKSCLDLRKKRRKNNDRTSVLAALERATVPDADAPMRACHRYLSNLLGHLDYQGALARGLPIGSSEIESARRYVVQQRLKRAGAWWTPNNAEAMLALRVARRSGKRAVVGVLEEWP